MTPEQLVDEIRKNVKEKGLELIGRTFGVTQVALAPADDGDHSWTPWKCIKGNKCCALSALVVGESTTDGVLEAVSAKTGINKTDLWQFIDGFDYGMVAFDRSPKPGACSFFNAGYNFAREMKVLNGNHS